VFCGSAAGIHPAYRAAAEQFGRLLVSSGIRLIFGGGRVGLMGVIADAVLDAGGEAIGVIPQSLIERELDHERLTRLHVVSSMHERKALMADLSDAAVLLPGGFGSLDEFSEVLTWWQLGFHEKPCAVLNVNGYYDGLLAWLDHATREGFVQPAFRAMILVEADPVRLLERLRAAPMASHVRWPNNDRR
jgi:hypothetical protein